MVSLWSRSFRVREGCWSRTLETWFLTLAQPLAGQVPEGSKPDRPMWVMQAGKKIDVPSNLDPLSTWTKFRGKAEYRVHKRGRRAIHIPQLSKQECAGSWLHLPQRQFRDPDLTSASWGWHLTLLWLIFLFLSALSTVQRSGKHDSVHLLTPAGMYLALYKPMPRAMPRYCFPLNPAVPEHVT